MVDALAKAIRIAWEESSGMDRVTWAATSRTAAKAAREFYKIPESAEKGAVGRLIDFHKRMLTGVVDADECRDILRAMGEKVAG